MLGKREEVRGKVGQVYRRIGEERGSANEETKSVEVVRGRVGEELGKRGELGKRREVFKKMRRVWEVWGKVLGKEEKC